MVHHQSLIDIAATQSVASSLALSNVPQNSFCIGDLEHALHITFAATRVAKGGRYVWVGQDPVGGGIEGQIEAYVDDKSDQDDTPLVLSGPSGVGKSALLANWLLRHESEMRRSKSASAEFVFWHVVGSSRQSTFTYELLRRLMTELKNYFELAPEVHAVDERLPWDLPRFLELAAKKGRVLIIIDGLHRLRSDTTGSGDLGLKWLPLQYPSNIKVIISTTSPSDESLDDFGDTGNAEDDAIGASEGKKERVLQELRRRAWKIVSMEPLKGPVSANIFTEFLQLSANIAAKLPSNNKQQLSPVNAPPNTFHLTAGGAESPAPDDASLDLSKYHGLLVFPSLRKKILSDPGANNPLFLRTLLHAAEYAASTGYDLWECVDKWMDGADDVNRLYAMILQTLEDGSPRPDSKQVLRAQERCIADGGLLALLDDHPWHRLSDIWRASQPSVNEESSQGSLEEREGMMDVMFEKKEDEVIQEKLMQEAGSKADEKLKTVRGDAESKLSSLYNDISSRLNPAAAALAATNTINGNEFLEWLDSKEGMCAIPYEQDAPRFTPKSTPKSPKRSAHSKSSKSLVSTSSKDFAAGDDDDDEYGEEDYEEEEYEEEEFEAEEVEQDGSRQSTPAGKAQGDNALSMSHSHSALPTFASERARIQKEVEARRLSVKEESAPVKNADGFRVDDLSMVPLYLKGGKHVNGFGPLLGYALSLLYVSRHGLRESELFDLLVRIKGQDDYTKSTRGTEAEAEMKLFKIMTAHRLRLVDAFKSFDRDGNGVVSHDEFREGIHRLHVDITEDQITMLLKSLDENHDGVVDFHEAMDRFERHARDYSHGKHKIDAEDTSIESNSVTEKKSNLAEMDLDFLNDSVQPGSVAQHPTLGAAVESSLLTALTNLGVIHAHKEQVLMLPLEAEALREVIWWRYIGSAEGQDKWHAHIVSFFMDQTPSIRRCEELPWHLFRCRRWSSLRNTLVDLRTFDLMYNRRIQLRGELFKYWKTLIEGPLYLSEEAEKKAYQSKIELLKNEQLLIELDSASRLGHSDSQLRKERLRGQLAPFDIVDEYNRAVETWHAAVRPNTRLLERLITNIGEFMVWFSDNMNAESDPPPFLRKTLNFEQLLDVGVDQRDALANINLVNHNDDERPAPVVDIAVADGARGSVSPTPFSPEKYGVGGPGLIKPSHYYFNRWVWIMFPWMALKNANAYSEQMTEVQRVQDKFGRGYELKLPVRKGSLFSGDDMDAITQGPDDDGSIESKGGSLSGIPRKIGAHNKGQKKESMFWHVKKMDPRSEPLHAASKSRDDAMIAAVVGDISAPNKMFDRLSEENRILGIAPREKPKPHRMTIEPMVADLELDPEEDEEKKEDASFTDSSGGIKVDKSSKIPFSYSSVKSQKHGSRFPSVEKFHKIKLEADERAMDKTTSRAIERFGGQEPPQTLNELVELKNSEELPMSASNGGDLGFLPAHSLTFPTTNEDALLAQAFARAGKMRKIYDKLRLEAKVKAERLEDMQRSVIERNRKDGHTINDMDDGEKIMTMLSSRLSHMNDAVTNAHFLGEFYNRILEVVETNPAKDKKHLDSLEQQLSLSKQQIDDMLKRRNALYAERDEIERKHLPRYGKEIKKMRVKKLAIEPKVEEKRKQLEDTKKKTEERNYGGKLEGLFGRAHTPDSAKARPISADATVEWESGAKRKASIIKTITGASSAGGFGGLAGAMSAQAGEYKKAMLTSAMEQLSELAGTTSGEGLVAKMEQNKTLLKTLTNQKIKFEEKVGKLKREQLMLQKELEELQFAGEEGVAGEGNSGTDVRKMDSLANAAEMRCHQNIKKVERQNTLIHYVKTGIDHLARIVDEMDASHKLPQSKVHLHLMDDDQIDEKVKLLSKTEDRLTSVLESLTLGSSNKQHNGDDGTMSIAQKQSEQAFAIHRKRVKQLGEEALRRPKSREALEDKLKPAILDANLSSPRGIRVFVPAQRDSAYDLSTQHVYREQNRKMDLEEAHILAAEQDTGKEEIFRFVNESLDTLESRKEQRKAHLLMPGHAGSNKDDGLTKDEQRNISTLDLARIKEEQRKARLLMQSTGNHKDKGLTMGTVLSDMEEKLAKEATANGAGLGASMKKSKKSPRSSIAVHDRNELKKISLKIKKTKEKEKKIAVKLAAEALKEP